MDKINVLLVGEFSGVHLELRNALREKGVNVSLFSDGDSYKKFYSDIKLKTSNRTSLLNNRYIRLLSDFLGLKGLVVLFENRKQIEFLKNYDVVQLINPVPFLSFGPLASLLLACFLKRYNKRIFLCALGDDYQWVKHCLSGKVKYSMFDRMTWRNWHKFYFSLKFVYHPLYILLDRYIIKMTDGIICGLYDYWLAYQNVDKPKTFIPLPISERQLVKKPTPTQYPIKIFHGWQTGKELRKGNDVFDVAIKRVVEKYGPDMVAYNVVKSVPYEEYIKLYYECDIFIDQCYSYDRGMNGLLGMAAAKVVFTGFDSALHELYSCKTSTIALNAQPDDSILFEKICHLVGDIRFIDEIKNNAREFVIDNHCSFSIAEQYLKFWSYL